jgi:IclR family transcriptional regulator, acetate operon repressor
MARFATAPESPSTPAEGTVRAVGRALMLLQVMAQSERRSWMLDDLSRLSGLPKSTTHRLLETMIASGFVERGVSLGYYRLGLQAAVVGAASVRLRKHDSTVQAAVEALRSRTGETAGLVVLSATHAVTVARAVSHAPLRVDGGVGGIYPAHASAGGKMLLAELSPEEFQARFGDRKLLTRYTEKTITRVDRLVEHLHEVRAAGFAIDDEEHCDGLRCVCVPVRIGDGPGRHAIGISAPAVRADRARLLGVLPLLRSAASEAAASLAMDAYR